MSVRVDLEHGKTYTVTASGEAFMTAATGVNADPFPGVVLFYGTDEEDCYAIRQTVLAPGKSITFRSPWNIKPKDDVYLMAFFLDYSPKDPKRGSYTLTIMESGEQAVGEHTIKAPFDGIIVTRKSDGSTASRLYRALVEQANVELQKESGIIYRPVALDCARPPRTTERTRGAGPSRRQGAETARSRRRRQGRPEVTRSGGGPAPRSARAAAARQPPIRRPEGPPRPAGSRRAPGLGRSGRCRPSPRG